MPAGLTSPTHLFVIIVVALVVLGPEKLPQALRQVGRTIGEVRRWSDGISAEVRGALSLDVDDEAPPAPAPALSPSAASGNSNQPQAQSRPVLTATPSIGGDLAHDHWSQHPALREGGEWH